MLVSGIINFRDLYYFSLNKRLELIEQCLDNELSKTEPEKIPLIYFNIYYHFLKIFNFIE